MYIITVTNKNGISGAPVICDSREQAVIAMRYLTVYSIISNRPDMIKTFCKRFKISEIKGYEDLEAADLIKDFFLFIKSEYHVYINTNKVRFRLSNEDDDVCELQYWAADELEYNLGSGM